MQENFEVFDFALDDDDMAKIQTLDKGKSSFFSHEDHTIVKWFMQLIQERKNRN